MSNQQSSKWCRRCKAYTLHQRPLKSVGCAGGVLLSILTLGLFFPFWILSTIFPGPAGPWRCQQCGRS